MYASQISLAQNTTVEPVNEVSSVASNKHAVSGFYNRMNVGVLGGSSSSPSFHIINGYRFNARWSTGIGLGLEPLNPGLGAIPIFAEGNYNVLTRNTTPWISVMAGYELPLRNISNNKGGITVGGKVGFSYFVTDHCGITTSVGYRYAYLRDQTNWQGWDDFVTVSHISRYEFRMGLVFK